MKTKNLLIALVLLSAVVSLPVLADSSDTFIKSAITFSEKDGLKTKPILGHTEFTLDCTSLSGEKYTRTEAVDIVPIFQEL